MKILIKEDVLDEKKYDSTADTLDHIKKVNANLIDFATELLKRAKFHDDSKLKAPEKPIYDRMTPLMKNITYGSKEYSDALKEMKPALDHHYAKNSHHPEHYPGGIEDMDILDIVEMLADWKAAVSRNANGSIKESLEINKKRFKIGDQLYKILCNSLLG